ncbi:MAG: hypothetical protein K0S98_1945 [Propionibacteriaceae bacterium]|nr:hypothetical protein [Propionibacteriaceae bacterium]
MQPVTIGVVGLSGQVFPRIAFRDRLQGEARAGTIA